MYRTTFTTAAVILVALLATTTGTGHAQEIKAYLKKSNPNELYVMFLHDSKCPGKEDSYQNITAGELVRARIKEQTVFPSNSELYLIVDTACLIIERSGIPTGFIYNVRPEFAFDYLVEHEDRWIPRPNVDDDYTVTIMNNHGRYGYVIGGSNVEDSTAQELRNALRETVSDILTDYLRANFDP